MDGGIGYNAGLGAHNSFGLSADDEAAAFSPSDLGGLRFWFNESSYNVDAGTNTVDSLTDQSSNGYSALYTGGGQKAVISTGLTMGLDVINNSTGSYIFSFGGAALPRFTLFFVGQRNSTNTTAYPMQADTEMSFWSDATKQQKIFLGASLLGTTTSNVNWYVSCGVFNTTASQIFLNGVTDAAGNAGNRTLTHCRILAGSSNANPFKGYGAEWICYETILSSDEFNQVNTYLGNKWGISVSEI